MNWGTKIVIGIAIFMAFIISLGYVMFQKNTEDPEDNYYEKGIHYNQEYDKEKNVTQKNQPILSLSNDSLRLLFSTPSTGAITFIRPANQKIDFKISFNTNSNNSMIIPIQHLKRGLWEIQIEWGNGSYLYKQDLMIP